MSQMSSRGGSIHGDAVRLAQLRAGGRPAVARESRAAGARKRRDDAGPRVDLPNHMIVALGDVEMSRGIELDLVRHVQRRVGGRPAIAGVALLAVAGDRRRSARLQVEPSDALIVEIAEVQRAVRSDHETVRVVDLPIRIPGGTRADERRHRRRRRPSG